MEPKVSVFLFASPEAMKVIAEHIDSAATRIRSSIQEAAFQVSISEVQVTACQWFFTSSSLDVQILCLFHYESGKPLNAKVISQILAREWQDYCKVHLDPNLVTMILVMVPNNSASSITK